MADLSYTVDVNTSTAQRNLDQLTKKIDKVDGAFKGLRNAIAGLAIGSFIGQAFQFADAMQDLSDATNIGTDVILGFSQAVQQAGGTSEKAEQGILKFVQSIGEAAEGSLKAQNAFRDVGITLEDLRTLSEQDLLQRAVTGLTSISDAATRSTVQMDLFGKALRGVNAQGLSDMFGTATTESAKYASSIKAAADAQQNFEGAITTIKVELLAALKPVSELAAGLLKAGSQAKEFIKAVFDIGVVVATFFAVTKVIKLVVIAFEALVAAPALIMRGLTALSRTWEIFLYQLKQVVTAGGVTAQTLSGLQKRFHWVGVAVNEIGKGLGILAAGFVAFYKAIVPESAQDKIEGFFGKLKDFVTGAQGAGAGRGGNDELTAQLQAQGEALRKQSEAARQVEDALAKRRKEIQLTSIAFAKQNEELASNIDLETSLIGKSEEYAETVRAVATLSKRTNDEVEKLTQAKLALTESEKALVPVYDAQIAAIQKQAKADEDRILGSIQRSQTAKLLEQDRLNNIERITQAIQRQQDQAGVTSGIYSDMQKKLGDITFGKEQRGRSIFDQQKAEIERNIMLLEADMAGAITAAFETEDGFTNIQQMNTELEKLYAMTKQLKQEQLSELDISRQWATGWEDAFKRYAETAGNAATQAGEAFNSITSNMNSAIDKFVDSGKFSFSDFANSVIKDLIKIELKAQASKLLSSMSSGIGGFLGNLFGGFFASGGQPPVGKVSVVGENGPELFVPKTAGTIVPNGAGSGATGAGNNTYITNNINAVDAKSVAQLFAENRRTLLGTVEMARKEMSYGR